MLNRFVYLYFFVVLLTCLALLKSFLPMIVVGHGFVMLSLGVWYGINRNWRKNKIDQFVYLICFLSVLGDTSTYWGISKDVELIIQIVSSLVVNLLYMSVFRNEQTYFKPQKKHDFLRVFIISFLIFVFFGYFLLSSLPNSFYFTSLLYTMIGTYLILLAMYRPVEKLSFNLVIIGLLLKTASDMIYALFYFGKLESNYYILVYFLYSLSQYLVIKGILLNVKKIPENNL